MKFGELKSIGHDIADALGSGICLLVGYYKIDVFAEAAGSPVGYIEVNLVTGTSSGSPTSSTLTKVMKLYQDALARLCASHGANASAFAALTARFATDSSYGGHFTVTVDDQRGRRSIDEYLDTPGR
ncbi:hypothetical protein [Brevundimonas sp. SGAir0440]|uniref:hypothetical protein n=1 Tax=Brevundimonas sp. SGAir0440 TaxID=2579977 RepID=UPI0010CD4F52|nr:hypothetical protein [Brevundimonas sp. SGAir0440]QCQ99516.1 hypothetical protein E7T10_12955 [Brevundimonas sp. SGAir0440]